MMKLSIKMLLRTQKFIKFLNFIERDLIKVFLVISILIFTYNVLATTYTKIPELSIINTYCGLLIDKLYPIIESKDGTLITIAAVFIGIYFTIFSLLSSVKRESTYGILDQENFEYLLKYIFFAFLGSFGYLVFSIFFYYFSSGYYYQVISLLLLIYMFLSALRLGTIIFITYWNDIKNFRENFEKDQEEYIKSQNLQKRINAFLDEYENKKQIEENKRFEKESN
jgi:hypothetical protein